MLILLLNYLFLPEVLTRYPLPSSPSTQYSERSRAILDEEGYILGIHPDGENYLISFADSRSSLEMRLISYNTDQEKLWERSLLSMSSYNLVSSEDYIAVIDYRGDSIRNFSGYLSIDPSPANITVLSKRGDILSHFPSMLQSFGQQDIGGYTYRGSFASDALISDDTLYIFEEVVEYLTNNNSRVVYFVHSYDILTGSMKWKDQIHTINGTAALVAPYRFYEIKNAGRLATILRLRGPQTGLFAMREISMEFSSQGVITGEVEDYRINCPGGCQNNFFVSDRELMNYEYEPENQTLRLSTSNGNSYQNQFDLGNSVFFDDLERSPLDERSILILGWTQYQINITDTDPLAMVYFMALIRSSLNIQFEMYVLDFQDVHHLRMLDNNFILVYGHDELRNEIIAIYSLNLMRAVNMVISNITHVIPFIIVSVIMLQVISHYVSKWHQKRKIGFLRHQ